MMAMGTCGAAMGGLPARRAGGPSSKAPPMEFGPPWLGGPETVLGQIGAIHGGPAWVVSSSSSAGASGSIDHAGVMRSLEVMGETIVPALHADSCAMAVSVVVTAGGAFSPGTVDADGFTIRYSAGG